MTIQFTQYLRPHGIQKTVFIDDMPKEIVDMADELVKLGCHFDIEELTTGQIHMSCENDDLVNPIVANAICPNGPEVADAVEKMIRDASATIKETE